MLLADTEVPTPLNAEQMMCILQVRTFLLKAQFHLFLQLLSEITLQDLYLQTGVDDTSMDFHSLILHVIQFRPFPILALRYVEINKSSHAQVKRLFLGTKVSFPVGVPHVN